MKFTVGLAPETLRRSNLGELTPGALVNLERALKANSRNSGHFVQGHVDCTGTIMDKWKEGDSLWIKVKVNSDMMKYIVPKGFICIDGTSLTICDVDKKESWFTFMLISHTQQNVIIPKKEIGSKLNIEVDVLAKMVEQSLQGLYEEISNNNQRMDDFKNKEIKELNDKVKKLELIVDNLVNNNSPSNASAPTIKNSIMEKLELIVDKIK